MDKVLVDTSVLIDFLRVKNKEGTLFASLVKEEKQLYISIITHTELYAGKSIWEDKKAKEELEILFSGLSLLPLEEGISQKAGEIKASYNLNLLDAIIAATALIHYLKLVTLNIKDFRKVEGLKL